MSLFNVVKQKLDCLINALNLAFAQMSACVFLEILFFSFLSISFCFIFVNMNTYVWPASVLFRRFHPNFIQVSSYICPNPFAVNSRLPVVNITKCKNFKNMLVSLSSWSTAIAYYVIIPIKPDQRKCSINKYFRGNLMAF